MHQQEHLRRIEELGQRYEARIKNQIGSINRILAGGSYDSEMEALHVKLAEVEEDRDRLRRELDAINH